MKKRLFIQRESSSISLEMLFEKFILFKKMNNVSVETIIYYEHCFRFFGEYYDVSLACNTVNMEVFHGYIQHLQKKTIKPITINSYLRGMRVILYYGMELGYIRDFKISLIKADKEIKETYTDRELEILLERPDVGKCSFAEYRTWVIINYLLGTGNRLSTMANVKNKDIDFCNGLITLTKTKNRKQQLIPLSSALSKILKEYLIYRAGSPDDYLFCNSYGEQLAKYGIQSSIKRYNTKRGVTKCSIHLFRHTFAKNWILNGGDIFRLQRILGHSSLDIVKEYVNIFGTDLQRQFDEFNPLDNITMKTVQAKTRLKMPRK